MAILTTPERAEPGATIDLDALRPDLDLTEFMSDGPPKQKVRQDGQPDVVWNDDYKWV